jgi:hypothetical protein
MVCVPPPPEALMLKLIVLTLPAGAGLAFDSVIASRRDNCPSGPF